SPRRFACGCALRSVRCFQLQRLRSHLERLRIIGQVSSPRLGRGRKFLVLLRAPGGWVSFAVIQALPVFNVSKACSSRCAIEMIWGSYSLWAMMHAHDGSSCRTAL